MKKLLKYCNLPIKLISLILLLLAVNGCFSIKPSTNKSGKKYFETFFVGDEGIQYFIKPFLFKAEKSSEELILDITFRYKNEIKDSAIVNFSINSSVIYKDIKNFKLSNSEIVIRSNNVELLFNEKSKKGFTSRYSTKFSLAEIKEMFTTDAWKAVITNQNKMTIYKPHKKAIKTINALREHVFVLM
ncbi:MAG: hypothetical protein GX259_10275 [Bacteroidales bacterium]|nr:hypothetical protein [Bacteroidales bacterium]